MSVSPWNEGDIQREVLMDSREMGDILGSGGGGGKDDSV
jgi:hypothetical protein